MINLLPPQYKQELLLEETKRLVIILEVVILASLVSLVLILFSIKTYLNGEVDFQKIILSQAEKEFGQSGFQNIQEKINLLNLTFSKLDSFYQEKFYFTEILEKVSKTLLPGTYLTTLSFSPSLAEEDFRFRISLSGFAKTREILLEFKEKLEAEEDFKEVYFPASNWVKPTDINFNLTFVIK